MLQNELIKREGDRKMSMNFAFGGNGGGYYPSTNIPQSPSMNNNNIFSSPMMHYQIGANGMMMDDSVGGQNIGYYMSGPPY